MVVGVCLEHNYLGVAILGNVTSFAIGGLLHRLIAVASTEMELLGVV